jgi:hypothetical protein
MGFFRLRRLQGRRSLTDINESRARWELFFYCWGSLLTRGLATVQAGEFILALIEGRPPRLLVPLPRL